MSKEPPYQVSYIQGYEDGAKEERERIVRGIGKYIMDEDFVLENPDKYHPMDVKKAATRKRAAMDVIKIVNDE